MFGMFRSNRTESEPAITLPPLVLPPTGKSLLVITHDAQRFFRGGELYEWNGEFARIARRNHSSCGFTVMHGGSSFSSLRENVRDVLQCWGLYDTFGTIVLHGRYNPYATKQVISEMIKSRGEGPELHILSNDYTQSFSDDHPSTADDYCKPWLAAWEYFLHTLTGVQIVDFRVTKPVYQAPTGQLTVIHAPSVDETLNLEGRRKTDRMIDELVDASLRRGPDGMGPFAAVSRLNFGTLYND